MKENRRKMAEMFLVARVISNVILGQKVQSHGHMAAKNGIAYYSKQKVIHQMIDSIIVQTYKNFVKERRCIL